MGERKGVNKYYPPDYDPSKGSINKHVGQHPLRERAKKISEGILVIRFEMPYNIWCGGCGIHIAMGVRYNAEKKKVDAYYTTPIYEFRMRCHLCPQYFTIRTDPKNHDYVITDGARRKEQRWDPHENEQIVPEDKATQKKLATDSMYLLEHGTDDKGVSKKRAANIARVTDVQSRWKDDYTLNRLAREKFRVEKKDIARKKAVDTALLKKSSLNIKLSAETEEDVTLAGLFRYDTTESADVARMRKRKRIDEEAGFGCVDSGGGGTDIAAKRLKLGLAMNRSQVKLTDSDALCAKPADCNHSGDKIKCNRINAAVKETVGNTPTQETASVEGGYQGTETILEYLIIEGPSVTDKNGPTDEPTSANTYTTPSDIASNLESQTENYTTGTKRTSLERIVNSYNSGSSDSDQ